MRKPTKRFKKKKNTVPNNVSDLIEQVETTMRSISSTSASDTSTEKSNDLHVSKYLNKHDVKDRFKVKTKRGRKSGREKFGKALDKPDLSPIKADRADKADKASKNKNKNTEPTRKK